MKRLWAIQKSGETKPVSRSNLSWADAMDELDIHTGSVLVVQAKTYEQSRSIKGIAVKAASRRYMAVLCHWDGEWVHIEANT